MFGAAFLICLEKLIKLTQCVRRGGLAENKLVLRSRLLRSKTLVV